MKNGKNPDPNVIHPIAGYDKEIYVKLLLEIPLIVGVIIYVIVSTMQINKQKKR